MTAAHPVEKNVWAMHRDFARNPGTVVRDDPDLLSFTTAGANAWLNGASWCQLGDDADERIAAVGKAAATVGARAQWTTSPSCGPADLDTRLAAAGWEPEPEPAMAVPVDAAFPPPPDGLVIRQVETPAQVREWTDLFDASFGIEPRGDAHPWLVPWLHLMLGETSACRLFLGRVDGVAVSCALAFAHEESVGLYGIGTPPQHRGRGFGSALTVAGINWGATNGATVAVLQASPMGEPVYHALGFRTVFEMGAWSLPPSPAAL